MNELDTEIRRVFGELVAATPAAPPYPTERVPQPQRPRVALVAALSALVLIAVVAGVFAVRPDRQDVAATPTSTATSQQLTVRTSLLASRLPVPVYRTMAASDGRTIYLLGGLTAPGKNLNTVYAFDPDKERFRLAGHLAAPTHGGAALWFNDQVFVFGGAETTPRAWIQAFDPTSETTYVLSLQGGPRADDAVARIGDRTFVLGGFNGVTRLGDVLVAENGLAFNAFASLKEPIRYPAVATSGRTIYLFGGLISGAQYTGNFSANIQSVDTDTGATKIVGQLPTPRTHAMAAVLHGRIFVIGGTTPSGPTTDVLEFDPRSGHVTRVATLPRPISDGGIAVVGDTAYIFGGNTTKPLQTVMSVTLGR